MKYTRYFVAIMLAIAILLIGSHFFVHGSEIAGIPELNDSCTVTILEYKHMEYENRTEYILDAGQIQQLKSLILDSSFIRGSSSVVTFDDRDQYDILIDFNNQRDYISIHSIGNEYILIANQFDGKHLKINNAEWKFVLEQIIEDSK